MSPGGSRSRRRREGQGYPPDVPAAPLTRERIVEEAIALLDAEGA
jgi:hypothetical protein